MDERPTTIVVLGSGHGPERVHAEARLTNCDRPQLVMVIDDPTVATASDAEALATQELNRRQEAESR